MSQVVVITGASAGIGRATAVAFSKRGAQIGLLARDKGGLDAALAEVRSAGGDGIAIPADVADHLALEAAARMIEEALGPIDVWVNNAMATVFAPFEAVSAEEFKRATEVTYLGMVNGTRAALKCMRPRNRGVIVQVGSALSYRSIPLQSPYCGAKFACRGFTDALRSELLHDRSRIRLTMVQLPAHNTPQFSWALSRMPNHPQPVPPIFAPDVAAEAILWASRGHKREVWVGWPTLKAILANMIAPGLIDHYLARTNYQAQQTDQPVQPDRPANLFEPASGWHATHGVFVAREKKRSLQMLLSRNSGLLIALAAVAGVAVLLNLFSGLSS